MPVSEEDLKRTAAHWDEHCHNTGSSWSWHKSPAVYNTLSLWCSGRPCSGPGELVANALVAHFSELAPFFNAATANAGHAPLKRGVSIGCGLGFKEIYLIKSGLVGHFTLYDVAPKVLESAQKRAEEAGIGDSVTCICGNGLELEKGEFDFVYWDNALHHMPSSLEALAWSKARLAKGGILLVNDYVGPNRFQFSDQMLALCNEAIKPLEISHVVRPDPAFIIKDDPTEAIDSAAIHPAMQRLFPAATHIRMGGVIYFAALSGRPMKISEDVVPDIMALDKMLSDHGQYLYAMYLYQNK